MFSSTNDGYFLHKQKKVITLWLNIRLQQNKTKKVLLEDFLALNNTEVFQPSKSINVTPWVYTSFFIIQL